MDAQGKHFLLVVEDDPLTLRSLRMILGNKYRNIHCVSDAAQAQQILLEKGFEHCDCLITDYRMPRMTGLELVEWVRQRDTALSIVMLTGEGDKEVIAGALRSGVQDFLEKPFTIEGIRRTVETCLCLTLEKRAVSNTVVQVKALEKINERLSPNRILEAFSTESGQVRMETRFHPIRETGGDFINTYPLGNQRLLVLLGDVSGHDLQAGFISAFFQGIVRGMVENGAGVASIARFFNTFLIKEWNDQPAGEQLAFVRTSLAAALVLMDFESRTIESLTCGIPPPWLSEGQAHGRKLGQGTPPLGWFDPISAQPVQQPMPDCGHLFLWSDGLEDQADIYHIAPLTLAHKLLNTPENERGPLVNDRRDDIILTRISWQLPSRHTAPASSPPPAATTWTPVFHGEYSGNQRDDIDVFQLHWNHSLQHLLPQTPKGKIDEILLCCREALLNALTHGCDNSPAKRAEVAMYLADNAPLLQISVTDQGEGFELPPPLPPPCIEQTDLPPFTHISYGLTIIRHCARSLDYDRATRSLQMSFDV